MKTKIKTGVELIVKERTEQLKKHFVTVDDDVEYNDEGQLPLAAIKMIEGGLQNTYNKPDSWDLSIWFKMMNKSYKERLIIAGALIAAEIDRIQAIEK